MEKESSRGNKLCKGTRKEKEGEKKRDRKGSGLGYVFPLICTIMFFHRAIEK